MPTPADLAALINTAGTDPDAYAVAADLAADLGDPREAALREDAAFWGMSEGERWRWVLGRCRPAPVHVTAPGGTDAVLSAMPVTTMPPGRVDVYRRRRAWWVVLGRADSPTWRSAQRRHPRLQCPPPACAPAVLAALRAALAKPV